MFGPPGAIHGALARMPMFFEPAMLEAVVGLDGYVGGAWLITLVMLRLWGIWMPCKGREGWGADSDVAVEG